MVLEIGKVNQPSEMGVNVTHLFCDGLKEGLRTWGVTAGSTLTWIPKC